MPKLTTEWVSITALRPDPKNPRTHTPKQIGLIAKSMAATDIVVPLVVNNDGQVISGHGRLLAAQKLGLTELPVIRVSHLTPAQIKAYQIADNKLTEASSWDKTLLGEAFQFILEELPDFDLSLTAHEIPEIDFMIEALQVEVEQEGKPDPDDRPAPSGPLVTQPGDLWQVLDHRVLCGDATDPRCYATLMGDQRASMILVDPPYNVQIQGNVAGFGKVKYDSFAMGCGEMTEAEFTNFLADIFKLMASVSAPGALAYVCMDWRHIGETLAAGKQVFAGLKNICVWTKDHAGQGSFYRSQHEMVLVFEKGGARPRNNIQLGRYGRHRSNVWQYPSPSAFGRAGEEGRLTEAHPTPKPVKMFADAILDCTARGDIVIDPFLGGGATAIAAQRVGRRCYGMELEPKYVDATLRRLRELTGEDPVRVSDGRTFSDLEMEAGKGKTA